MNEIYWITRFDSIVNASELFTILGLTFSVVSFVLYAINRCDKNENWMPFWKRCSIICVAITLFSEFALIFVPTSKDAMLIMGVGGTIDYIKSNGKIKQIPDKCFNALDAWVDSLTEKEHKDEN